MQNLTEQRCQQPRRRQQVFSFCEDNGQLFATYCGNDEVVHATREAVTGQWHGCIYLWGEAGSGKSHLLQAACMLAEENGIKAYYGHDGVITEAAMEHKVVCIDDLQTRQQDRENELRLLACYEQLLARRGLLLLCANVPPAQLQLRLADMSSRLVAGLVFRLSPLDDAGKMRAMQLRLKAKSMQVADDMLRVLLQRLPRDTHSLFRFLDDMVETVSSTRQRLSPMFIHRHIARLDS